MVEDSMKERYVLDFLDEIKRFVTDDTITKLQLILLYVKELSEEKLKRIEEDIQKIEEQRNMYKEGFEKLYELLKNILETQSQKSVDYDKRIKIANKIMLKLSDKFGFDYEEVDLTKLPSMTPEEKRKLLENLLAIIQSWFSDPFTYKSFWYGIWFADEDYLNLLISRLRG